MPNTVRNAGSPSNSHKAGASTIAAPAARTGSLNAISIGCTRPATRGVRTSAE